KPIYYTNEKNRFGTQSQLCIKDGQYEAKLENFEGRHKIVCKNGNSFVASTVYKNGIYSVNDNVDIIDIPEDRKKRDLVIQGKGSNGQSLRAAQVGALYSVLSHWSLSTEAATIVLPTGTGK